MLNLYALTARGQSANSNELPGAEAATNRKAGAY